VKDCSGCTASVAVLLITLSSTANTTMTYTSSNLNLPDFAQALTDQADSLHLSFLSQHLPIYILQYKRLTTSLYLFGAFPPSTCLSTKGTFAPIVTHTSSPSFIDLGPISSKFSFVRNIFRPVCTSRIRFSQVVTRSDSSDVRTGKFAFDGLRRIYRQALASSLGFSWPCSATLYSLLVRWCIASSTEYRLRKADERVDNRSDKTAVPKIQHLYMYILLYQPHPQSDCWNYFHLAVNEQNFRCCPVHLCVAW
jgi:hypothetical protein